MGTEIGGQSVSYPDFGVLGELTVLRMSLELDLTFRAQALQYRLVNPRIGWHHPQSAHQAAGGEHEMSGTTARTFVASLDEDRVFNWVPKGALDSWEEWY